MGAAEIAVIAIASKVFALLNLLWSKKVRRFFITFGQFIQCWEELKPNGGTSMKDHVTQMHSDIDEIKEVLKNNAS